MSTRTPPAPLKQLPPKVRAALRSIVARAHLDAIDRGEYQWSIGKEPLRAAGTSLERTRSEIERKKREKNFIVRVNTGKDEIASYQVKNDVGTRIVEAIKFHAASQQRDAERSALFVRGTRVDWVCANQPTWESYQFAFRRAAEVLGNESELPILPAGRA